MKQTLLPILLAMTPAIMSPFAPSALAKDGGGGGEDSCEACASRLIWGRVSYYCQSGYDSGLIGCETVDVPGPDGSINTCTAKGICVGGEPWPWVGVY